MTYSPTSSFLQLLQNRITLEENAPAVLDPRFQLSQTDHQRIPFGGIPFSERGSRILLFRRESQLFIRLAERWSKWVEAVGDYRHRAPVIDDFVFTDANGAPLDFILTAYPHALCFATRLGDYWLTFANEETLYVKLPAVRCGISFRVYATRGHTDRRGGEFKGDPEHRTMPRNIAYTTNARIVSNTIEPGTNDYQCVRLQIEASDESAFLLNITPRLGFQRRILAAEKIFDAAETRWHQWFASAPPIDEAYAEQYYYAWWIMRMGLLSPRFYLTREAMMPSAIHYIGVWQWDAFFHAIAYRHIDLELAEDQLRVVLDHQREDGMIPDAIHDEGVVHRWKLPGTDGESDVTKPPLIGWAALKLYATSGNRDFLDEIYEPLCRWNRWWFEKNDDDHDGIAQYNHGFSSGLDDSPLWDEGMPVESPELNTYLVMQMDALAEIATILGLSDDATMWRASAEELAQKIIAHFWDEDAGVFWAMRNHQPIRVLTPFNLYPLLTGRMPRAICERLVAHLTDPNEFWTAYPIPTVARNDSKYNPNQMWRGPTWVNINYLFIEGLQRIGYSDRARELRDKTLAMLMRHNDIYEYYNPETGNPPPHAASVFGWSSAVFIDLALQASRAATKVE
jgi:glycogen debranching enzyme